jgi:putative endonuclease
MYFVYIIYSSESDIYYKGFTSNIVARLEKHNSGSSTYTSSRGQWILKYSKSFETKKEALLEEKRLKRLNRISLEKLIAEYASNL